MIFFSALEVDDCLAAHEWHLKFCDLDDALYPRTLDDFETMIMDGCVWAARSTENEILALAYASFDDHQNECEIGGLMVSEEARGNGLGCTMMQLALAHALLEENLLERECRIVAHVVEGNPRPRGIILDRLRFHHAREVSIDAEHLPGLRSRDGKVHGDEFEFSIPDSIHALAEWASGWTGEMGSKKNQGYISLRRGLEMSDWARALTDLASKYS